MIVNNEMNIGEIVAELDRINTLYIDRCTINASLDNIVNEMGAECEGFRDEITSTLKKFKEEQDKKLNVNKPSIASGCLTPLPAPPKKPDTTNPIKDIYIGALSGLILMLSVALWLLLLIIDLSPSGGAGMIFSLLLSFIMIVSICFWYHIGLKKTKMIFTWQNEQDAYKKLLMEWKESFDKDATKKENERFLNEFKQYDTNFLKFAEVCSERYDEEVKRYEAGLETIKEKYTNKSNQIFKELAVVDGQLADVTLIHSSLFYNAWRISSVLKIGRANTLQDAINLALDEERKDNEEAARREEARQQEAILEQQAIDNRMHNAAMLSIAEKDAREMRAHNERMESVARQQAYAAQEQAKESAKQSGILQDQARMLQKQANDARHASHSRCARCVNRGKCTSKMMLNSSSCPAYRPR